MVIDNLLIGMILQADFFERSSHLEDLRYSTECSQCKCVVKEAEFTTETVRPGWAAGYLHPGKRTNENGKFQP